MVHQTMNEWRVGRNYVRVGDVVKILPSRPGKQDGYEARVREIAVDNDGTVRHVEVLGGSRGKVSVRFVRPDRVARVAQYRTDAYGRKVKRERRR